MCYNKHTLQFIISIQELFFVYFFLQKTKQKNNSVP